MAVPKRRTSRMKRDQRRAQHDKVRMPNLGICTNCGDVVMPHRACPSCGYYKGRPEFNVKGAQDRSVEAVEVAPEEESAS